MTGSASLFDRYPWSIAFENMVSQLQTGSEFKWGALLQLPSIPHWQPWKEYILSEESVFCNLWNSVYKLFRLWVIINEIIYEMSFNPYSLLSWISVSTPISMFDSISTYPWW